VLASVREGCSRPIVCWISRFPTPTDCAVETRQAIERACVREKLGTAGCGYGTPDHAGRGRLKTHKDVPDPPEHDRHASPLDCPMLSNTRSGTACGMYQYCFSSSTSPFMVLFHLASARRFSSLLSRKTPPTICLFIYRTSHLPSDWLPGVILAWVQQRRVWVTAARW
jgi:hypothetical protein